MNPPPFQRSQKQRTGKPKTYLGTSVDATKPARPRMSFRVELLKHCRYSGFSTNSENKNEETLLCIYGNGDSQRCGEACGRSIPSSTGVFCPPRPSHAPNRLWLPTSLRPGFCVLKADDSVSQLQLGFIQIIMSRDVSYDVSYWCAYYYHQTQA